ncbi:MAG: hypothetical protein R6V03_03870 [Kiritimatiellia bacterium]
MYKFRCPGCKGKISVDEDYYREIVGKVINCPHCSKRITIPRMQTKKDPDVLPSDAFKNTQQIKPHPAASPPAGNPGPVPAPKPQTSDPDSAVCPHCGAEVGKRDKVCITCGEKLNS